MSDACASCGESRGFKVAFSGGELVRQCRACGFRPRAAEPAAYDEQAPETSVAAPPAAPARRTPKAPPRPQDPGPSQPLNVLAMARARLREVNRQLREHARLQKEKAELERIIAAAEGKREKRGAVVSLRA